MGKIVHDDVLDGALNIIKNNVTRQVACSAQPTTYTEANATYALADATMASGDFTNANGDTSGRKTTVAAKPAVLIDTISSGSSVDSPVISAVQPVNGADSARLSSM